MEDELVHTVVLRLLASVFVCFVRCFQRVTTAMFYDIIQSTEIAGIWLIVETLPEASECLPISQ
jgi:hypothetical protein